MTRHRNSFYLLFADVRPPFRFALGGEWEDLVAGSDQRSPLAIGMSWASRISAVGFEFALPPLAGYFVDRWLGSSPVGTLLGMIVGFLVGMMHLLKIAKDSSKPG